MVIQQDMEKKRKETLMFYSILLLTLFLFQWVDSQCNCPNGAVKCYGTKGFLTCNSGSWVYRQCGYNSQCLTVGSTILCAWVVPKPTSVCTNQPISSSVLPSVTPSITPSVSVSVAPPAPTTGTGGKLFSWPSGKKLIVYHTNWATYGRNYQVKNLPIDSISDVNYAFFNLVQNGQSFYVPTSGDTYADFEKHFTAQDSVDGVADSWADPNALTGNFNQFIKLKKMGKKFSFGLSVGGWTWSTYFSTAFSSDASRTAFVNRVVELIKNPSYSGLIERIDLDWEYLSAPGKNSGNPGNVVGPNDSANFVSFLSKLKTTLTSQNLGHIEITTCMPADALQIGAAYPLQQMAQYIDSFNIMTYDMASSSFGPQPAGHQSNLCSTEYAPFSIDRSVKEYLSLGVPANKIVIGAVAYSRGFANTDGLGKPSSGVVSDMSWEAGVCDYKTLPRAGATEYWDAAAKASYSYDPVKKILNSYDTPRSVLEKAKYVWKNNLKGVIVWESSGDYADSSKSVIYALAQNLKTSPDLTGAGC